MEERIEIRDPTDYGLGEINVIAGKALTSTARLAEQLAERWGMVAAEDDGEDSAGRQKVRLATPIEVIERACAVASLLHAEFTARGWYVEIPTREELIAVTAARAVARDAAEEVAIS